MALFRPRLTDHYGILVPQADLDFAIPFLDEDIPFMQTLSCCGARRRSRTKLCIPACSTHSITLAICVQAAKTRKQ
jgi:hypothetical protein